MLDKRNKKENSYHVIDRNRINNILEDIIKEVDYLVVHNCNNELKILGNNGINLKSGSCICTSNLFKNSHIFKNIRNGLFKTQPSLEDLAKFLNINVNKSNFHFAYYDVEITRKCFFKIMDNIINEDDFSFNEIVEK